MDNHSISHTDSETERQRQTDRFGAVTPSLLTSTIHYALYTQDRQTCHSDSLFWHCDILHWTDSIHHVPEKKKPL